MKYQVGDTVAPEFRALGLDVKDVGVVIAVTESGRVLVRWKWDGEEDWHDAAGRAENKSWRLVRFPTPNIGSTDPNPQSEA